MSSADISTVETFLRTHGLDWGINILSALAIFVIGKWVAHRLVNLAKRMMQRSRVDDTLVSFLGNVFFGLALALVAIAALSQLGVETTSLAAVLAAAGLAIGLSLQSSLANLAAGVMIITFRPFRKGDYVEVAGTAGTVEDVNIFTTHLATPDNKAVIVPNGSILSQNIINYSAKTTRRVDLVFSVSYHDDLARVKRALEDILAADSRILKDPAPVIAVSQLAESSVDLVVRPWVNALDYWPVTFDLQEQVKQRFDEEGISIPYPQRDVYMRPVGKGR